MLCGRSLIRAFSCFWWSIRATCCRRLLSQSSRCLVWNPRKTKRVWGELQFRPASGASVWGPIFVGFYGALKLGAKSTRGFLPQLVGGDGPALLVLSGPVGHLNGSIRKGSEAPC